MPKLLIGVSNVNVSVQGPPVDSSRYCVPSVGWRPSSMLTTLFTTKGTVDVTVSPLRRSGSLEVPTGVFSKLSKVSGQVDERNDALSLNVMVLASAGRPT